ncbi:MAG: helix-turn-helix domain-containing protein [Anaerocolumna sp.]
MNNVGERIKKIRKEKNVTQKEFSERVCVTQSYISRIEKGKEMPTDMFIKLTSLEFNVSLAWLRNGEGKMDIGEGYDYFARNNHALLNSGASMKLQNFNTLLEKNNIPSIIQNTNTIVQALGKLLESKIVNPSLTILIYEQITNIIIESCDFINDLNDKKVSPETVSELYKMIKKVSNENYDCLMEIGTIYEKILFKN